ncbi:MAG: family 1 encapsulin nanocompartment shell protein [Sphingomonas bacterium]
MNNLHRELAPISDAAWEQIDAEAARTLKRYLAARRVVDVPKPKGQTLAAVGTGHSKLIESPGDGVQAVQRIANAVVQLRVPFTLTREAIDDVEHGSEDSDWSPLKEAARTIAYAENRAVFDGYPAAGIGGIRPGASNMPVALLSAVADYPAAVAKAVDRLRLAGVEGPYRLVLGDDPFTAICGGSDEGYPVLQHIKRLVEGEIVWAPGVTGGLVLTTRGGDFELVLGQDLSIGYLSHTDKVVDLYLQESFTFRLLTTEAVVALTN